MAASKTGNRFVGELEADADSIDISKLMFGGTEIPGPISLSAEAEVKEELRRILRIAQLTINPDEHTFVVTTSNGGQVWLEHGDVIEDNLDDLTSALQVEIVKFGNTPQGTSLNINELNIFRKQ